MADQTDSQLGQALRGKFIVLDGVEGCGKSTQARLLAESLTAAGASVLAVRDPGTTPLGEKIRQMLLDPAQGQMSMRCEMLLYMAARAQMMSQVILPALLEGEVVVCDRFISSTLAYQLGGDGLTASDIRSTGDIAIGGCWPDLTIILDMPVERSMARLKREKDRIEQRGQEYHQRVRRNYLAQAKADPYHFCLMNADRPVEEVRAEVWGAVKNLAGEVK